MWVWETIEDQQRANGDRHKLKGMLNSILGRPDWAAYSYVKMLKNYARADWKKGLEFRP